MVVIVHQHERMHLGAKPLRQFGHQPEERPAIVVPPEEGLPAVPTARHVIPTIDNMDAKRSCHPARLGLN